MHGAMKLWMMDILACPVCKGELELTVEEQHDEEVVKGSLYCAQCQQLYRIADGIPDLLPPEEERQEGKAHTE